MPSFRALVPTYRFAPCAVSIKLTGSALIPLIIAQTQAPGRSCQGSITDWGQAHGKQWQATEGPALSLLTSFLLSLHRILLRLVGESGTVCTSDRSEHLHVALLPPRQARSDLEPEQNCAVVGIPALRWRVTHKGPANGRAGRLPVTRQSVRGPESTAPSQLMTTLQTGS